MFSLNIRRRSAAEAGFVLPTAVIVLFIIAILAGAAVTVATQSSISTARDNNVKAGLAAAEAGLQVASYRVSQLKPTEKQCITSSENKEGATCESNSESIGNGGTFRYWTTQALAAGAKCAGQTIATKAGVAQRCVTSEGQVNGVKPGIRLQARVESAIGESLFLIDGILGLEEVKVTGSVKATAIVASNVKIEGTGSAAFEKGFELCPGGKFKPEAGKERNKSGVTVGGVGGLLSNPPLEITRSSGCPIEAKIPAVHATAAENEDSRIGITDTFFTEGKSANKFTGAPSYELTLSSNSKLTLGGSKYYFCNLIAERNGELKIAAGAKVEIFIDSHTGNPNCATTAGTFSIGGNAHLENPNGSSSLLVELAGKGPLSVENSGSLKASIFAPEAEIILNGAGTLTGAVVGNKVHLEAGSFIFSEESATLTTGASSGGYSRKGWEQCTPGSGASEGC